MLHQKDVPFDFKDLKALQKNCFKCFSFEKGDNRFRGFFLLK